MGVNSLPKTVTRQRRDCDLNPGPSAPESSTLTTRLPSHPATTYMSVLIWFVKMSQVDLVVAGRALDPTGLLQAPLSTALQFSSVQFSSVVKTRTGLNMLRVGTRVFVRGVNKPWVSIPTVGYSRRSIIYRESKNRTINWHSYFTESSVARYLRCDGIFRCDFVANLPLSL